MPAGRQPVDLARRVRQALTGAGLHAGSRVVAAVSGGVDSMTLLDLLAALRGSLGILATAVHVHHGLRGSAADRDASFVQAEAAERGVPCRVVRLEPSTRPRGDSVQVWAREARYAALEEERRRLRAAVILTAHTRNDQAETLLLNLLRGAGLRGMGGIPKMRGRILRPLLSVERAGVEAYAAQRGVRFREDASNRSTAYTRNRIRRRLLPLLAAEYNPRIVESLAVLSDLAREDEAALTEQAEALAGRLARRRGEALEVSAEAIRSLAPALGRRVLRRLFQRLAGPRQDLTRRHVSALLCLAASSGRVLLPGGLTAWRAGDRILLGAPEALCPPPPTAVPVRLGRWVRWPLLPWQVRIRRVASGDLLPAAGVRWSARLDAGCLEGALCLRTWQPGDRFHPLGGPGRKKLQDFFVDAKVPRAVRRRVPVLCSGDRLACVVGYRLAEPCRDSGRRGAGLIEMRETED